MNQLTEDQKERVKQIRQRNKCGDYDLDIDFLLSLLNSQTRQLEAAKKETLNSEEYQAQLLDSQAAGADDANVLIRQWIATLQTESYVTEEDIEDLAFRVIAFNTRAATLMRDKCVSVVRALAESYSDAWARQALVEAARDISSLTLDTQEK